MANKVVERSSDEVRGFIKETEEDIVKVEGEIAEEIKLMSKNMAKGKLNDVRHNNRMIQLKFTRLDSLKGYIEQHKKMLVRAIRIEGGYQEIVYFLEFILQQDMEWHKKMVEKYNNEILTISDYNERKEAERKWNKSTVMFAKMKEEEAYKIFQRDLDSRFEKLIKQLQDKVGAVTNVNLQRNHNDKMDGRVTGEKGTVYLETIVAEGPIQRAHYRTLIKPA